MSEVKRANPKMVGKPTPPEVVQAINTIARYLREGGWVEVIIADTGAADFRLTSLLDEYLVALNES